MISINYKLNLVMKLKKLPFKMKFRQNSRYIKKMQKKQINNIKKMKDKNKPYY